MTSKSRMLRGQLWKLLVEPGSVSLHSQVGVLVLPGASLQRMPKPLNLEDPTACTKLQTELLLYPALSAGSRRRVTDYS